MTGMHLISACSKWYRLLLICALHKWWAGIQLVLGLISTYCLRTHPTWPTHESKLWNWWNVPKCKFQRTRTKDPYTRHLFQFFFPWPWQKCEHRMSVCLSVALISKQTWEALKQLQNSDPSEWKVARSGYNGQVLKERQPASQRDD
jgi:hypothetical protein